MSAILVDDTDLTRLTYAGRWMQGGSSLEYNSTTHGTATSGSTVTFKFQGTSVSVWGTISATSSTRQAQTVSTYKLDKSSSVTYTAPVVSTAYRRELFYQSPMLEDANHTLVITATSDDSPTFWLDYISYTGSAGTSSSVTMTSITSHTPFSSASQVSRTANSTNSLSTSASSSTRSASGSVSSVSPTAGVTTSTSRGPNTALLVAAIVTPILLFLLLAMACLWRRKRRWQRSEKHLLLDDSASRTDSRSPLPEVAKNISPFTSYPAPPAYTDPDTYRASALGSSVSSETIHEQERHPLRLASRDAKSASLLMVSNPSVTTFTQHADGGVRLEGGSSGAVEVPPIYGRY